MSRIDELIERLCPDGVPFRTIDSLVQVVPAPKKIHRSDYLEQGAYPVIDQGASLIAAKTNDSSALVDVGACVLFGDHTRTIKFYTKPFAQGADGLKILVPHKSILPRYLFHAMKAASIPNRGYSRHWSMAKAVLIPIPPMETQEEIVRILDSFSELEAELEAELGYRQSQYAYYRNHLLSHESLKTISRDGVKRLHIEDVCTSICSGGTPSTKHAEYYIGGTIPWIRTQDVDYCRIEDSSAHITEIGLSHSAAKWIPANCVIVAMYGATAAKVAMNSIPVTTNQACCNLAIDNTKALPRYVYHWLACHYEDLKSLGEGSQANISGKKVRNYPIDVPSLSAQKQIVDILDKFDALVNDLSSGIPAEIEARRKQYEYYRDKLLTFKEKPSG